MFPPPEQTMPFSLQGGHTDGEIPGLASPISGRDVSTLKEAVAPPSDCQHGEEETLPRENGQEMMDFRGEHEASEEDINDLFGNSVER